MKKIFSLLIVFSLMVLPTASALPINLLHNSSFEMGTKNFLKGWYLLNFIQPFAVFTSGD